MKKEDVEREKKRVVSLSKMNRRRTKVELCIKQRRRTDAVVVAAIGALFFL